MRYDDATGARDKELRYKRIIPTDIQLFCISVLVY